MPPRHALYWKWISHLWLCLQSSDCHRRVVIPLDSGYSKLISDPSGARRSSTYDVPSTIAKYSASRELRDIFFCRVQYTQVLKISTGCSSVQNTPFHDCKINRFLEKHSIRLQKYDEIGPGFVPVPILLLGIFHQKQSVDMHCRQLLRIVWQDAVASMSIRLQ